MAEAVAAFSLASNVLQFVDFGFKIAAHFQDFYRSSHQGNVPPDIKLQTVLLKGILADLVAQDDKNNIASSPFQALADQCCRIADELVATFCYLDEAKSNATGSKMTALKLAFKRVWKEDDIARLELRLDHLRSQLVLQLVSESRNQIRSSPQHQILLLRRIDERIDTIYGVLQAQSRESDSFGTHIVDLVVSRLESQDRAEQKASLRKDILQSILKHDPSGTVDQLSLPSLSAQQMSNLTNYILARLYFSNAGDRVQAIATAHAETFQWIFDDNVELAPKWSSLTDWFGSNERLYWVTGKAGSGKSTLMKYICQPEDVSVQRSTKSWHASTRCDQYLRSWAAHPKQQIMKAAFFLWNSGAEMQMSQHGLLRSLLYQILSQAPSLIPSTIPDKWEALCLFHDDTLTSWTDQELAHMLKAAADNMNENMRLCLFVDGLDEFGGDLNILVQIFKELSQNAKIKICVSSRPWELFETAFDKKPCLRMEDLTYDDIRAYTSTELCSNLEFSLLQRREPDYANTLVESIVNKASGVFLWVKLVVQSLLAGIGYGDRLIDLQKRLDTLPPELEKLYDKMLDSLDPFYLEHAAQYFVLKDMYVEQMSTIVLSFIDDETFDSALQRGVEELTYEQLILRHDTVRRRINSRTKGLLEITKVNENDLYRVPSKIDYLHRTVKDYVKQPAIETRLKRAIRSPFDGHMQICVGILAFLKTRKPMDLLTKFESKGNNHVQRLYPKTDLYWSQVFQMMHSASRVSANNHSSNVRLLDALDSIGMQLMKRALTLHQQENSHSASIDFDVPSMWLELHPYYVGQKVPSPHFHSFAIRHGVVHYVKQRVVAPCTVQLPVTSHRLASHHLILDSVQFWGGLTDWTGVYANSKYDTSMIEALIVQGARFEFETFEVARIYDPTVMLASLMDSNTRNLQSFLIGSLKMIELFITNYDHLWPAKTTAKLSASDLRGYHRYILQCGATYALAHYVKNVNSKALFASMSYRLSDTGRKISRDRLVLLKAMKAFLTDQ